MDLIETTDLINGLELLLENNNFIIIKRLLETNSIPVEIVTNTIKKYYAKNSSDNVYYVVKLTTLLINVIDKDLARILLVTIIESYRFVDDAINIIPIVRDLIDIYGTLPVAKIDVCILPDELFFEYINENNLIIDTNVEYGCSLDSSINISNWIIERSTIQRDDPLLTHIIDAYKKRNMIEQSNFYLNISNDI